MTTGETEETCGGQKTTGRRVGGGGREGNMKLPLSFTTLSTIAIQAGQSLIVVSVLKSGSLVHLQLVQVHPGLCEIGLNQEENQTLIQEQQQLMEKLKKHELEVLSVVDKSRHTEQRRRRAEGMMEQERNKKQEEEEEVHKAMVASLNEGWSLLLRLLERRQEVLTLAADFYGRVLEFAVSIDRVEDLHIRPDSNRLTEVQLTYDSMRRDLLGKSLQVLSSSSVLLQKLRQLQRTEALQRRGGVLQDEEQEEQDESSQCSRGMALRLEELVESLQDRRRKADQAVRLQLQQTVITVHKKDQESSPAGSENWSLTVNKILDQSLQSGSTSAESTNLRSDSRTKETRDLQPGSRSEQTRDKEPGSRADLKHESRLDQTPGSRSDVLPGSGSDVKPESRSEPTRDIAPGSRSEETRNFESGSRLDLQPEFRSDLKSGTRSQDIRDLQPDSRSDLQSGSRSDLQPGFRLEFKPGQSGFKLNLTAGSRSDLKSDSKSEETRDLQLGSSLDQTPGPRSDLKPKSKLNVKPRSEQTRDMGPGFRLEETRNFESGSRSDLKPESRSDLKPTSISEETKDLQPESRSDLQSGSRSEETTEFHSKFKSNVQAVSGLDLKPGSRSEETRNFELGSRSDLKPESSSDLKPGSRSEQTKDLKPGSKSGESIDLPHGSRSDLQSDSRSEESRNFKSGFRSDIQPGSRLDMKSASRADETRNLQFGSVESKDLQPGSRSDVKYEFRSDLKPESRSEQTRDLGPESRSQETTNLQPTSRSEESRNLNSGPRTEETRIQHSGSRSETKELRLESTPDVQPRSRSEKTRDCQSGSRSVLKSESRSDVRPGSGSDLKHGSRSEAEDLSLSGLSRKQEETKQHRAATTASGQAADLKSMLGNETQSGEDHAHQALLTNQRQQLLSLCEHLVDKVWSWVQEGSSVLSNSSETGQQLFEAEDTLNTHLQLHTQAESAGRDAENMKQILDQIRALHTDSTSTTSPQPPSEPIRQLSPLKALTEQLKRGSTGRRTRTIATRLSCLPAADPTGPLSPELADRVDLVLKELLSLNRKIDSNLQLLQPFVTFLRMAQQVEEEMEELREIYRRRPQKEEEEEEQEERGAGISNIRTTTSSRSPVKKKQLDACWQETLQRFLTCQELGNNYVHAVTTVSGAGLNLQSVVLVVQQTVERLSRTKQEVNELLSHQQIQIQQQQEYCRKYRERLLKTLQDMNCVSELLDSCTLMDLGSDLQTSRLVEHFSQARPHFIQLDAEVEYIVKSWETLRGVQDGLEVKELKGRAVKEEDLSELLKLQERVKNKIHQSESILNLTSSFHITSKQLEVLLHSDPGSPLTGSAGLCGSTEAELSRHKEEQQQIQSLFKKASTLKTDICTAVNHSGWTCFRVEQLEARLLSLDSLCVSWLNEAARREEKLRRDLLTRLLHDDINQLRDSFKELKKRFSNLKFNYVKRNDRTRNMKAVRNQLQQVELYEEKLQVLRKRLQGVTARLGSEVKDGGVAREAENAVNELQRQMGEFGRNVSEHQKTLEMTCRLQQAMEEYQLWCEEASATIARVGKFSSECRSTEAVSVLYRQFEKFVWPTVPQQEERISQITELAVRLHGVDEGRRYIEKTVSKHSEMVESIRELSDGLMELEAKLKVERLKQQQSDGEKEIKEEEETEQRGENETEEKEKLKENRKMKKKEQTDNRSTQEAADMYELKETGHTPELSTEHDGKEVPVKRQTAANRKPPLQKSRSQEADRQTDRQTVISESSHRQQLYSERFTSSYCSTHTFSLSCSPVEANRRVRTIHSQLQPVATEPQAMPPSSVIGPSFSDIQREFQRKEMQETGEQVVSASCGSNMALHQDASAGGLSEVELQQQEVMTEDSLSNDEYECASPDDISLPPLAETPESNMIPSDVEEGFCFSSHSIHINQYSHQCRAQSEHSGTGAATGAVRQQRESSQSCPTPPTCLQSSSRFRPESCSFVQSPLTVPAPSLLSSTLCSILRTGGTSTANIPQSADLSLSGPELSSGSNPVHKSNAPDSCSNKDNSVPEKRSPSQNEPLLKGHNSQYSQPQRSISTQGKITQNAASNGETLPQTDPVPQAAELSHSPTQQTIYFQSTPSDSHCIFPQTSSSLSSPQESPLSQSETLPQIDPVPEARWFAQSPSLTDSVVHNDRTRDTGLLKSCATCLQTSRAIPQDNNLPKSYLDSRSGLDQDVPSFQTSKETPSVSMPQSSSLTKTTTVNQQTVSCQSFPPNSHCNVPQANSNLRSQQESPFSQGSGGLPEVHAPTLPEPNSISNISISSSTITSSNRFSSKQSHQTVYSLHESLTSSCTQQCVHDPGMTPSSPAKPAAPPQPEVQTQALAQQANLHVNPLSSPPHLLTPDQDPNICQPMAIREEIRLTPQIQGPPLPAPPLLPQAQAESLPKGKASKPGPPCFTRPLSRATVMEGSPVTLEVEVTGHPEPMLTWFKDGELSATGRGRELACEDGEHFLFIPEASDSDCGLYEDRAADHHDPRQAAGNTCSSGGGDKWLVAEVFDIISVDWQTWFGTLCVLLWLLYLIVL